MGVWLPVPAVGTDVKPVQRTETLRNKLAQPGPAIILTHLFAGMKVTLNWLKQYVDFNWSPEELAERLTMLGLEVEGVQKLGGSLPSVPQASNVLS